MVPTVTYAGKNNSTIDKEDRYMSELRSSVIRIICLLGVKSLEMDIIDANNLSRAVIKSIVFFDEATEGIRNYTALVLPGMCDILASIGISGVSVVLREDELEKISELWKETTDGAIDKIQADKVIDDIRKYRKAVDMAPASSVDFSGISSTDRHKEKKDASDVSLDAKIDIMYANIAELLPIEGRDYALNPTKGKSGGVHLDPVAYTKIGRLWLEYLREVLPPFSVATESEKEEILNAKP